MIWISVRDYYDIYKQGETKSARLIYVCCIVSVDAVSER